MLTLQQVESVKVQAEKIIVINASKCGVEQPRAALMDPYAVLHLCNLALKGLAAQSAVDALFGLNDQTSNGKDVKPETQDVGS